MARSRLRISPFPSLTLVLDPEDELRAGLFDVARLVLLAWVLSFAVGFEDVFMYLRGIESL
jgi:hypothetical protein